MVYVLFNITFMFTGQITRLQTAIFILGANPLYIGIIMFVILIMLIYGFIRFIHKKTVIRDTTKIERKNLQVIFTISLILVIATIISNIYFLKIENSIITDREKLISYKTEQPILQDKLSRIDKKYEGYNVVFILLESVSAKRVGAYGYSRNTTPNIDKLAKKGIIFSKAYATSSHSDYAQPALLSSRYILTNNLRTTFDQKEIPRKFIWDVFKENNYTTGYFSSQDDKWQNMDNYINYDNLDEFSYSRTDGKTDYGTGLAKKDFDHKTSALALQWLNKTIKRQQEINQSFFLYLNFQATHLPNTYPEEYSIYLPDDILKESNRYDNSLTYVDAQIGKIITFIEDNNLKENTIIVITSDHGHDLEKEHGIGGHGFSIYDEELIVPLIAYIPETVPSTVQERVSHIDIAPTLVDLMGFKIPNEFQGDIMRVNRPIIFFTQNHKYLIGMIENDTKTIIDLNRKVIEIYNLNVDPNELKSLKPSDYQESIVKLLFWHYCQLDYYKNEKWNTIAETNNRCTINNNFKM